MSIIAAIAAIMGVLPSTLNSAVTWRSVSGSPLTNHVFDIDLKAGTNRVLLLGVSIDFTGRDISSATFDTLGTNVAMTAGTPQSEGDTEVRIFHYAIPDGVTVGLKRLQVTLTGDAHIIADAVVLNDHTVTGLIQAGNHHPDLQDESCTLTSVAAGSAIFSLVCRNDPNGGFTPTSGFAPGDEIYEDSLSADLNDFRAAFALRTDAAAGNFVAGWLDGASAPRVTTAAVAVPQVMAPSDITFNAEGTYSSGATAVTDHDITNFTLAAGVNRKLVVGAACDSLSRTITSAVFDPAGANIAMTALTAQFESQTQCRIFWCDIPDGVSVGAKTIRVSYAGTTTSQMATYAYCANNVATDPPTVSNGAHHPTQQGESCSLAGVLAGGLIFSVVVRSDTSGAFTPAGSFVAGDEKFETTIPSNDARIAFAAKIGVSAGTFNAQWDDTTPIAPRVATAAVAFAKV